MRGSRLNSLSPALSLWERVRQHTNRSMTMKYLTTALLLLLALGGNTALAAPAWHDPGFIRVAQKGGISLDQAVEQVREQTGGRILAAQTVREDGHRVHRIKVLTPDHKVRVIRIRAD